jgi:hypothetical protein
MIKVTIPLQIRKHFFKFIEDTIQPRLLYMVKEIHTTLAK